MLKYVLSFCMMLCATSLWANSPTGPRILVMGDSLMSANTLSGRSIGATAGKALRAQTVKEVAVPGARMLYALPITGALGFRISSQYRKGQWDWIVLNGGGNDLLFGCACGQCKRKMERLIDATGTQGEIPRLVSELRATGAKIAYVGYLRSPGIATPIERCRAVGDELERRIANMAMRFDGVFFLSNAQLVPHGDRSFFDIDLVHPSQKGSQTIGKALAQLMYRAGW